MDEATTEPATEYVADHGAEIARLIRVGVRGGEDDATAIVAAVREAFGPEDIDDDSLHAWVDDAMSDQLAVESTWADETDCDRLDAIFAELQRQGILVLPNAGLTQEEALSRVAQAYQAAGAERSGVLGFCFYTRADLDRVADDGELMLAFGDVDGNPEAGAEVGRRIQAALDRDGFAVHWDGTPQERIAVADLNWQRRRQG